MDGNATDRVTVLNEALVAVRRSIDVLLNQSAKQAAQNNAKLIYLNTERSRKRPL